jgi:hypothetical protein
MFNYVSNTIMPIIGTASYDRGGMFYIKDAMTPTQSDGNTFKKNFISKRGGALSIINSKFFD